MEKKGLGREKEENGKWGKIMAIFKNEFVYLRPELEFEERECDRYLRKKKRLEEKRMEWHLLKTNNGWFESEFVKELTDLEFEEKECDRN